MRILGKYAIVLIEDGEVFYIDELGRQAVLGSGHVIMVTPELAHAYGSNDGNAWSQTYVVFDGAQFDLLQKSKNIRKRQPFWSLDSLPNWKSRLEAVLRQPTAPNPDLGIRTLGNFVQLLIEMTTAEDHSSTLEDKWLMESINLLGELQETGWEKPQQVAIKVGLSYENFRKLFTQRMGKPPAKYQLQRKIDRACAAIYQGSINFKELAEELDFCDVYHFSKVFRQIKGIPPSTYRRTVRGK
jgi:AraC-like DNA-binding protein